MYLMMTKDKHVLNMPYSTLRPLTSIMSNYTIIQPPSNPPHLPDTSALVHVCQSTAAEIECAVISIKAMVLISFALVLSLSFIIFFLLQDARKQEWTAIIPNSQLIVIPYPQNDPRSWSAKLYLTPSNIVLLTAIALIGVCVFILVIIGILHWKEKKADDREKRQEAHRFHFDAM